MQLHTKMLDSISKLIILWNGDTTFLQKSTLFLVLHTLVVDVTITWHLCLKSSS